MKYFLFLLFFINLKSYPFQIEVVNIIDKKFNIYIVVFDHKDGFPFKSEKGVFKWSGTPLEAEKGVSTGLPSGNYAVAVFQDIDGNGDLNRWFFGKPREPYGVLGALKKPKKKPDFFKSSKKVSEDSILQIRLWQP